MVDILMATYNGSTYIDEQIDSLLKQTYTDWKLYIRDDGSKDDTLLKIRKYQEHYPNKIVVIEDNEKAGGAKENFHMLLKYSKSEYTMFCDQDDFWLSNKIELALERIKKIEEQEGKKMPILVHSDLKVVDKDLNVINDSFWKFSNIDPYRNSLNYIIISNTITGCTAMINKSLKQMALKMDSKAIMHDWWIALIASSFGKISIIETPTILYRQHGNNTIGATTTSIYNEIKKKIAQPRLPKKTLDVFKERTEQMDSFYEFFEEQLSEKQKKIINDFRNLKSIKPVARKRVLVKNKYYSNSKIDTIKSVLFL